jgi:outer membrane protein insertion porin family
MAACTRKEEASSRPPSHPIRGLAFVLLLTTAAWAQDAAPPPEEALPRVRIDEVVIEGNQRVEREGMRIHIRTRAGTLLDEKTVDTDIRELYAMGFFDDVEADLRQEGERWILVYRVNERPLIRDIEIKGNEELEREELDAALKLRPNTILDRLKLNRGIQEAKKLYDNKGYLDADIQWSTAPVGSNEVVLTYTIDEKEIVRVQDINFEGARAFTPRKLRGLLQTQEEWLLSFVTGAGNLDREILQTDMERLTAFYYDNGYIDVRIDEPVVERNEDGLQVTIKIDEGEQYTVGKVDIGGDQLPDMTRARSLLQLTPGETFRSSKLRDDITTLTEVYGDQGYAFVNVAPDTPVDPAAKTVDVIYTVSKGPVVFIDKIIVTGNTKTRDKVIRRELELEEQRRFSGRKLRRSQLRLQRLGFFEDVNLTTRKADQEDRLDLLVDVKEGSTGTFSAGAGVSSGESFLFNVRLAENNLFGRGQRLVLNADFGSIRRNFTLDFTEPYLFDTQLTFGIRLFNWELFFDDFTRGGTGASFRLLYPFVALGLTNVGGFSLQDARVGIEYRIEESMIDDVSSNASPLLRAEQGTQLTSSITPRLLRDTRNHPFVPTDGSLQDFSLEIAGLGGESKFIKFESVLRWYYPLWRSETLGTFVLSTGSNFAYGLGYGEDRELPLFERYFPGGINSVRGFEILSLGPQNLVTNAEGFLIRRDRLGGSNQLIFNNELIVPLVESLGLRGVVFFDAGNAFSAAEGYDMGEMRLSTGAGVRWLSPIGPLRIEVGFPLNPKRGDDEQRVMFSFGGPP